LVGFILPKGIYMQGIYGGLIIIINYASGIESQEEDFALLTESSLDILTETSNRILVEG
jgi:hypothetical protein